MRFASSTPFVAASRTEAEILNQVETIAAETGSELDSGWDGYCAESNT